MFLRCGMGFETLKICSGTGSETKFCRTRVTTISGVLKKASSSFVFWVSTFSGLLPEPCPCNALSPRQNHGLTNGCFHRRCRSGSMNLRKESKKVSDSGKRERESERERERVRERQRKTRERERERERERAKKREPDRGQEQNKERNKDRERERRERERDRKNKHRKKERERERARETERKK